ELRHVHDVFVRLGAEKELDKARIQFREVGARPPPRYHGSGASVLTDRETEVAALVARGLSNKRVGKELGISPRTVSTHLSNIYQKLEVGSRMELSHLVKEGELGP
ncbi:MAG TPA: LuxR C-terminal-related transcriptional regulator, partial [Longimicrobiales bacterium]|nr:LuxR C-terminal-related transcriptional regulator [Longimicrobiales bacterium]